jgi:hypothetical protein
VSTFPIITRNIHERHLDNVRYQAGKRHFGLWALQRKQCTICQRLYLNRVGELLHDVDVSLFAGCVHHDKQVIGELRHHQIVKDAACFIGENSIALPSGFQTADICWYQTIKVHRDGFDTADQRRQAHLPHVTDIKKPGVFARPKVFFHYARAVLHWHLITGKRHHLRPERDMQIKKRRAVQL